MADPRSALEALVRERGEDYASLSRLIGRNPAYIQQFIARGTPKRLAEEDRRILAAYFRVPESLLGGRDDPTPRLAAGGAARDADLVAVPRLAIGASAGPGAVAGEERTRARIAFDARWLRDLTSGGSGALSIIGVEGDSMAPTLTDGDEIMVDRGDAADRLRDGIYVLRVEDALIVKRLAIDPSGRSIAIRSDNPAYPDWPDRDPATIAVIGRVVWTGRRIR